MSAEELKHLGPTAWCLDSGATRHLTCNADLLMITEKREIKPPCELRVADNKVVMLRQRGKATIRLPGGRSVTLRDVAYDASLAANLLSVSKMTAAGFRVEIDRDCATVRSGATNRVVMRIPRKGRLYVYESANGRGKRSARNESARHTALRRRIERRGGREDVRRMRVG